MIYLSFLIPLIAILVLFIFFRSKTVWWEYVLLITIPTVSIFVGNEITKKIVTDDYEYWNDYIVSAIHDEPWDEWIEETCVKTTTDSEGNTHTTTYDCSHSVNHSEKYTALTANSSKTISISPNDFENFCKKWNNKTFVDMHRDFYTKDGDRYTTKYNNEIYDIEPYMTQHTYENRIQSSRNILNYATIPPNIAKNLIKWPTLNGRKAKVILNSTDNMQKAEKLLYFHNSVLGSIKQIHMMILCFWDTDISIYSLQEAYWKGGNKNELSLCVGLSSTDKDSLGNPKVLWVKTMAWNNEQLKKELEGYVISENYFYPEKVVEKMAEKAKRLWNRKQFKDFKYIQIEIPTNGLILINVIIFIITIALVIFVIKNNNIR